MKTTVLFAALCASAISAQDLVLKAPAQSQPIYLHNATVHTVSGPTHEKGGVLFDRGKIVAVYKGTDSVDLPPNTKSIDLEGRHVYPGLVTVQTSLGLSEIGAVRMSIDTTEVGDITPEVRANIAVNPDSTAIPVARSNGILTMGVFPSGGLVAGRVSAMTTEGWTWEDMTLVDDAGLVVQWPSNRSRRFRRRAPSANASTPADRVQKLDEVFARARAWHAAKKADPKSVDTDLRFQAMGKALRGEAKVFVIANELDSITAAVQWGTRNKLQLVIVGGRDAVLCADLLKRHSVEVVISGTHSTPKRRDVRYDSRFVLPKQLHATGVKWCLGSGGRFANERNLPYHAATAVAFGLSEEQAIRSITLDAAKILGVADRVGSLEKGKDATLIVTDGSPLDLVTVTEHAFIQGRKVALHNKHRALAAKYRAKYEQRAGK